MIFDADAQIVGLKRYMIHGPSSHVRQGPRATRSLSSINIAPAGLRPPELRGRPWEAQAHIPARDEVTRMRAEGYSWRKIAKEMDLWFQPCAAA
jgi:hypothetical protein